MLNGDDLDARFNELVSQIDAEEQRRMRAAAGKEARKARAEQPRPERGRGRGRGGPGGLDDGGRGSAHPRRPRRILLVLTTAFAVAAAGGLVVTYRPDLLAAGREPGTTQAGRTSGAIPEETTPVTGGPDLPEPTDAAAAAPTADLFADSPARDYADGIAGFVMPKAAAVGGLSKKDVAAGLKRVRDLFAAAHLDRKALLGGPPTAYAELLHPDQARWFRKDVKKKPGVRGMVHSFAPKTAELVTDVIKVHGTTKVSPFRRDGLTGALVRTNYLIVYGIQRPGQPATAMRLVAHHRGRLEIFRRGDELITWVVRGDSSRTPARCDIKDGYIHPFYDDSAPSTVSPTGAPQNPYDLDRPESKGCNRSTGT
ncbi:hypothetical protein HII36_53510 [Nonomuraea sp. NN258]|uniref:hypothetical protein n=1 Tax=Nonomuraea antri TaxID=2730852 RepID=UPI00156993B6|nr:hypothetical protein [Nonomuraea antri]NRQ40571.1 hypothetical protein [Nonomuraea antri]